MYQIKSNSISNSAGHDAVVSSFFLLTAFFQSVAGESEGIKDCFEKKKKIRRSQEWEIVT